MATLSAVLVGLLLWRTDLLTYDNPGFAHAGDWHKYLYMSTHSLGSFHIAPYCWRVAVPFVAGLLPFDPQWSFLIISGLCIWATATLIYYLCREFGFDQATSIVGFLLYFSLGWATKVPLKYFWLVDASAMLVVTAGVYALIQKRTLMFVLLLTFGVLVKESVLFIAPLYYALNTRKLLDFRLAAQTVIFSLPAVAVIFMLRWSIPVLDTDPAYLSTLPDAARIIKDGQPVHFSYLYCATSSGLYRLQHFSLSDLHDYTIGTFGAASTVLAVFYVRTVLPLFWRFLPFLVLVYSQLIFALNTERLLVMAFPAVIPFALLGLTSICGRLRIRPVYFVLLPVIYFAIYLIDRNNIRMPFESTVLVIYLAVLFQISAFTDRTLPSGEAIGGHPK